MATQRRNPLTGEWIIVSPNRLKRPWDGEKTPSGQVGDCWLNYGVIII